MGHVTRDPWRPRPLAPRDLEAPYTAGLRRLPPADREALRARRAALLEGTRPWNARTAGRLRRYVAGAGAALPLLALLLPGYFGPADLLFLLPLAVVYGALVALLRPGPFAGAVLLWGWAFACLVLAGYAPFTTGAGLVWFYHALFLFLGAAVGVVEDANRVE